MISPVRHAVTTGRVDVCTRLSDGYAHEHEAIMDQFNLAFIASRCAEMDRSGRCSGQNYTGTQDFHGLRKREMKYRLTCQEVPEDLKLAQRDQKVERCKKRSTPDSKEHKPSGI